MTYDEFRKEVESAIELFPLGHKFNLREVLGTKRWNELKELKLNYGSQFFKDYEENAFPTIKICYKSSIQGEQIYQKCK